MDTHAYMLISLPFPVWCCDIGAKTDFCPSSWKRHLNCADGVKFEIEIEA